AVFSGHVLTPEWRHRPEWTRRDPVAAREGLDYGSPTTFRPCHHSGVADMAVLDRSGLAGLTRGRRAGACAARGDRLRRSRLAPARAAVRSGAARADDMSTGCARADVIANLQHRSRRLARSG